MDPICRILSDTVTFTPSQKRVFEWVQCRLNSLQVAVVGPAGTGKSYVLNDNSVKKKQLVAARLAPSGVAAQVIGGTIHNFFSLDIDYNSTLENGTVKVARLRKIGLVIDEFKVGLTIIPCRGTM